MDLLERIMFEHMTKLSQHVGEKVKYNGAFNGERIKNAEGRLVGISYNETEGVWYAKIESLNKIHEIPIKKSNDYISDIKGSGGTYFNAERLDSLYTARAEPAS